ncbi:MAG: SusD/RagB family nutrient-binding outer membrane lipoprotein, partial [Halanaerobiales bacterium]|nr:SusD/RagB family nutrient-binding outer membrane lipoprotein [Halanaerobiales bacterium]
MMNIMKKIYLILVVFGLFALANSCSEDFGDLNVPSDAVVEVEAKFFFNAMEQEILQNYQRNVNLFADFYAQYWANTVSSFPSPRYEYVDIWIGNQWREHYTRNLRRAIEIQKMNEDDPLFVDAIAIKEIWMCYIWSRITDYYGDVPYFGAGEGVDVPYTPQSEIYDDLFKRLDVAINSITDDAAQYKYDDGYDLIFDGDAFQWRKFGNSLRLRLAMRISNVDATRAQSEVQAAVNGPGGLLASNADVVKVPIWSQGWYDYLNQMAWNWNNIRMSKTFSDYLYNQSSVGEDPRAPKWFAYQVDGSPATKEVKGEDRYLGIENGHNIVPANSDEDFATINLEGGYIDFVGDGGEDFMYCPVMFYSEVKFLLAEAALRGWVAGDVAGLYEEGIQASMDYVGVDGASAQAYIDGLEDLPGGNEAQLKQII